MCDGFEVLGGDAMGRQDARRVARVYASLFDMLLYTGDDNGRVVRQCVDVDLGCTFEELVDEYRLFRRGVDGGSHILGERFIIVDDRHRTSAEHKARPDDDRITYLICNDLCFVR